MIIVDNISERFDIKCNIKSRCQLSDVIQQIMALDIYTKGIEAWFEDPDEGWTVGQLSSKTVSADKVVMLFTLEKNNKARKFVTILGSQI